MATKRKNNKKGYSIKRIEKHLYAYTSYKTGLINLQNQLDFIMPNTTASYELVEGSTGTFNIKSSTEQYAIDRIESKRALFLHEEIEEYNLYISAIDAALNELTDLERQFIELRYFKRKPILYTALEMGYSEKHIYTLRISAFDKLLICLKGLLQF